MKSTLSKATILLLFGIMSGCQTPVSLSADSNYIATHNLSGIVDQYLNEKVVGEKDTRNPKEFAFCVYKEIGSEEQEKFIKLYLFAICGGKYSSDAKLPPFRLGGPIALTLVKQSENYQIISHYISEIYDESEINRNFPDSIRKKLSDFNSTQDLQPQYDKKLQKLLRSTPKK